MIGVCEDMARIVFDSSLVKYRLQVKEKNHGLEICSRYDLGIMERAKHLRMQLST